MSPSPLPPSMRTRDFDYELPRHLIAQTPVEPRDHSRLLVLNGRTGGLSHRARFFELADELRSGDLLVMNDSRVLPARLYGVRLGPLGKSGPDPEPAEGRRVELLLLRRLEPGRWLCLGRPARHLRPGVRLLFSRMDASVAAEVEAAGENGLRTVRFAAETALGRVGHTPLPPYIHTPLADPERYQTVYARSPGSAAAPTAGLHFTPELLARLSAQGVRTAYVTLHVGLDTFRPVHAEDPRRHRIHTEYWELGTEAATALNAARAEARRVIAVGTTTVRVLEQAAALAAASAGEGARCEFTPGSGWADLFILPGYRFRAVDALVTNFHLPRSTLLMLVCAFAGRDPSAGSGRDLVLRAYQEAIAKGYRFYSFGDATLIV